MNRPCTLTVVSALLLSAVAQAATVSINPVFPENDIVISNLVDEGAAVGVRDIGSPDINANPGQSFVLTNATTVRALTFQLYGGGTGWGAGTHEIELWIGEDTDSNVSNFVAGATNLLTSFDLAGTTIAEGEYITIDLDSDLVLPAGDYGFQMSWVGTDGSHQLFLRRANGGGAYADGGLMYFQTANGDPVPFPFDSSPLLNSDMVFAIHSAPVGVYPFLTSDPEEVAILLDPSGGNLATGTVDVVYNSSTTMDITMSISAESHPGAFSVVSANPQTLTTPYPASSALEFGFDNTTPNLSGGAEATGLVTIAWSETGGGGASGQVVLPINATVGYPANQINAWNGAGDGQHWGDAANWALDRVPGAQGADQAIIQTGGVVVDVATNFTATFPFEVIVRNTTDPTTLGIGADLKNVEYMWLGRDAGHFGLVEQTAGDVESGYLKLGESGGTAVSNSVYHLLGGTHTVETDLTAIPKGEMKVDGGTLSINGLVQVNSGGSVIVTNGTLVADADANEVNGNVVNIAAGGILEVSGGTFDQTSGGRLNNDGTFRVLGDEGTINVRQMWFDSTGTFEFVLNGRGVGKINNISWGQLNNCDFKIDGSDYVGTTNSFVLYEGLANAGPLGSNYTVVGLGAEGVDWAITEVNGGVGFDGSTKQMVSLEILTSHVPVGFGFWVSTYGLTGPDADWDYDYDGDNAVNLSEYAFGGDPTNALNKGFPAESSIVEAGGTNFMEYVYARRKDYSGVLDYTPEFGSNLVITNWSASGVVELPVAGEIDPYYESVTNRVDITGKPVGFMQTVVDEL